MTDPKLCDHDWNQLTLEDETFDVCDDCGTPKQSRRRYRLALREYNND